MRQQALLHDGWQHGRPILLAFATPHDQLIPVEVHILHSDLETLLQAETGPGEQWDDDPDRAMQLPQERTDLLAAEHNAELDRNARSRHVIYHTDVDAEDLAVQERARWAPDSAWTLTRRSTASHDRNAAISPAPIAEGCFLWWKKYRRIQSV
jgi:hypothetical protein